MQPMVLTILEARISQDRAASFQAGYQALGAQATPPGLLRSQLARSVADPAVWQVQTLWRARQALDDMRSRGTPGGVLLFRDAGAEPSLAVFEIVATIS